jgi:hypothetical protein
MTIARREFLAALSAAERVFILGGNAARLLRR